MSSGACVKVVCVGGGPAGLYFSILMKLRDQGHDVTVYERDPAGSTYGWGVTYWGTLLEKLHAGDPVSARAVEEASVRWRDGVAHVRGTTTRHSGDEGFGIGRHRLLELLADRARDLGVRLVHEHEAEPDEVADGAAGAGLVVAADGVRSALRGRWADHFGTEVTVGRNPYIWLGTSKVFDAFTFSFVESPHGWIWCYAYRYDDRGSTLVVECAPETWRGLGLDRGTEAEGLALLGDLFADVLDGHPLTGRGGAGDAPAQWLTFRTLTNRTWHRGNVVLLGDAAHTTHYSIGAGTSLALEDALALAGSLHAGQSGPAAAAPGDAVPDEAALEAALSRYEDVRRAELLSVQSAARYSARWYEDLPRYLRLPPEQMFALLGQRHSPLLPYVPPQLYYRLDHAAGRLESLRRLKRWLGPRLAGSLHARARDRV
ncbi:FAD-dependent monooxygenase [Streptomyces fuscigenes]|uniref:FAD-dependent monooxygenase n=1 Tax=Streptomyces fuscigenes TaxID=1528880 RepID=UPI001F3E057D|nr:FAD-dependent monooxygenase [Streptomyces fuscigenes]MCF3965433.1 FAD-dependent monooxygenase [Streptomyces fuscigenes]